MSPLVQVKYNCDYDYDNQKFHLVEGETLILISKSNHDWWLCLRLADKLTFFVPATYVREVECAVPAARRMHPPPRPPPPPPPVPVSRASTSRMSDDVVPSPKPQVKKRQQHLIMGGQDSSSSAVVATATSSTVNVATTSSSSSSSCNRVNMADSVQSVYENLAESGSGPSRLNHQNNQQKSQANNNDNNDDLYGLNPDAIISDLDDRLNREEESFVNRENAANAMMSSSGTSGELERRQSTLNSGVFGVVDSSKSVMASASIDADYVSLENQRV